MVREAPWLPAPAPGLEGLPGPWEQPARPAVGQTLDLRCNFH